MGLRETDMDVMRQPLTTIIVGLSLILTMTAPGGTAPVAGPGPIPQARRLIEAGDHAAALTILEDALIEATAKDRPTILDLLRQSYEVLARKAEAAGKRRDAAHHRDNLAILEQSRSREPESRARPIEFATPAARPPKTAPTGVAPSQVGRNEARQPRRRPDRSSRASAQPTALPEPDRLPAPETMGSRDPVLIGADPREKPRAPARSTPAAIPARGGPRPAGPAKIATPVQTRPILAARPRRRCRPTHPSPACREFPTPVCRLGRARVASATIPVKDRVPRETRSCARPRSVRRDCRGD